MNEKLSDHFTLDEMTRSNTAITCHLNNTPNKEQKDNLIFLCTKVLEPTRNKWGKPIVITSGFRSKELNKQVGGVPTSYHCKGLAADIKISSEEEGKNLATLLGKQPNTDLVLFEHSKNCKWIHVQARRDNPRRKIDYNYNV